MDFVRYLIDFIIYVLIAAALSWFFYYLRRFDLLGGFTGGAVVALLGAILGTFLLQKPLNWVIDALQSGFYISNVNVIAALLGGSVAVILLTRANHGKKRRDY